MPAEYSPEMLSFSVTVLLQIVLCAYLFMAGTGRVLILGDMNAYRMEDPIRALRNGGYTELVEKFAGLPQYSYRFFGQAGTLDYAFASDALAHSVRQARIWHINTDWPRKMDLPRPWLRMSDHDPVIVDIDFSLEP